MDVQKKLDILEDGLRRHRDLLNLLLTDMTLKTDRHQLKNTHIIWATNSYAKLGKEYGFKNQITEDAVTGKNTLLIQPRVAKSKEEQQARTHNKAEVFTPKDIVSQMNQSIDGKLGHWPTNQENWQEYIKEKRLEISCGEAPFIVGRYNAVNGKKVLKLESRVGFLDHKLQVVSEYCKTQEEWVEWAKIAFQSSYGYEWQGDSLLIARENLLYTFIDYFNEKFPSQIIDLGHKLKPDHLRLLQEIATIISWNLFQMDGLKCVIPMSCKHTEEIVSEAPGLLKMLGEKDIVKRCVCEGCLKSNPMLHNGKKVKIMDWETGKPIYFYKLLQ